jgi:anti-sigma-K factor RskA
VTDEGSRPGSRPDGGTRSPGWREVIVVAGAVVAVVLGAAFLTDLLPGELRALIVETPLAIVVLVAGTALVLWRAATRRS